MTSEDLSEYQAFYLIEASDQDPEPTPWDDEASLQRKLDAKVAAAQAANQR